MKKNCPVNEKSNPSVKGFTLIELIIVIAIIAVLGSILPSVITGYRRDAKLEAANENARIVYTAAQNMLIDMEIKNQTYLIDGPYLIAGTESGDLLAATISFSINDGEITSDGFEIRSAHSSSFSLGHATDGSSFEYTQRAYAKLKKYFADDVGSTMTGSCLVYVDLESMTVDSVLFREKPDSLDINGKETYLTGTVATTDFLKYVRSNALNKDAKHFLGMPDLVTQKKSIKTAKLSGEIVGVYPMLDDIGETYVPA